jgi:hypothetical protein
MLESMGRRPVEHAAFGCEKVHSVERKNVVKVVKGRLIFFDHVPTADHRDLFIPRNHNPSHLIVDSHIVDLPIEPVSVRSGTLRHRKQLHSVVSTHQQLIV